MIVFHKYSNTLTSSPKLQYVIPALNAAGKLQIAYTIILQHYQTKSICSEIQILVTDRDTDDDSHNDIDSADSLPFVFRNVSLTRQDARFMAGLRVERHCYIQWSGESSQ